MSLIWLKKINCSIVLILILFSFSSMLFAQAEQTNQELNTNIVISFGPLGLLNVHEDSAPSPINISLGAGAEIKILDKMSVTPHATYFGNYYLWEDNQVLPAEIEHRGVFIPSLMLDIPVTYDVRLENSIIRMGGGLSFLLRFAVLSDAIPPSASLDIQEVNKWLWEKGRFFYPSVQFSWDYFFDSGVTIGLGAKAYIPITSLFTKQGINNGIASISLRFIPTVRF